MSNEWQWCGAQHHWWVDAPFHLSTVVADGRWLVSTVGGVYRDGQPFPIGIQPDLFFESIVFHNDPKGGADCPVFMTDLAGMTYRRYATPQQANDGHMSLCREWSDK